MEREIAALTELASRMAGQRSGRGPRDRGTGDRGTGRDAPPPPADGLAGYLAGRLPDDWFTGAPEVHVDRDEITIVGTVAVPDGASGADAETGRIRRFREQTRDARIDIAREIESRFGRQVAWGVVAGGTRELFTNLSVPTMTRLRQPERIVLDTLVDAGVARSRSEALGWCVRLVAANSGPWLAELRAALAKVEQTRAAGPDVSPPRGAQE